MGARLDGERAIIRTDWRRTHIRMYVAVRRILLQRECRRSSHPYSICICFLRPNEGPCTTREHTGRWKYEAIRTRFALEPHHRHEVAVWCERRARICIGILNIRYRIFVLVVVLYEKEDRGATILKIQKFETVEQQLQAFAVAQALSGRRCSISVSPSSTPLPSCDATS